MEPKVKGLGATSRIIDRLIPEWIEHQKRKAKDYNSEFADGFSDGMPVGFENADVLGIPGQFAEIWRKIWKLKRGMWDGAELVNESVREILLDLIGHCFLAIDMIDRKAGAAYAEESVVKPTIFLRSVTGHGYDGCPTCVEAREANPELLV